MESAAGACDTHAALIALCGLAFLSAAEALAVVDLVGIRTHSEAAAPDDDEWRRLARKVLALASDLDEKLRLVLGIQGYAASRNHRSQFLAKTTTPDVRQLNPRQYRRLQEHVQQRAMLTPTFEKKSLLLNHSHSRALHDEVVLLCENVQVVRRAKQNGGGELQDSVASRLQRMRRKLSSLKIARDSPPSLQGDDAATQLALIPEGRHSGLLLLTSSQISVTTARLRCDFRVGDVKVRQTQWAALSATRAAHQLTIVLTGRRLDPRAQPRLHSKPVPIGSRSQHVRRQA